MKGTKFDFLIKWIFPILASSYCYYYPHVTGTNIMKLSFSEKLYGFHKAIECVSKMSERGREVERYKEGDRGVGGGVWWERKWTHEHKRFPIHGSKSKTTKEGKNECIKHAIWLFTPISQTNEIQFLRIFNVINFHTFRLRKRWLKVLVSAIFSPYVIYNTQTHSIIEPDKKGTPNHTHTHN